MPDFLLHTPGDFSNQLVVMEVKSNPALTVKQIQDDLLKIQEFIQAYRYTLGIFIAVNQPAGKIEDLLNHIRNWHQNALQVQGQIVVIFKDRPEDPIREYILSEI